MNFESFGTDNFSLIKKIIYHLLKIGYTRQVLYLCISIFISNPVSLFICIFILEEVSSLKNTQIGKHLHEDD